MRADNVAVTQTDHVWVCDGYVFVDLRGGYQQLEIGAAYRRLAVITIDKNPRRALVVTGDDDATAHYALRDAFTTIILAVGIPRDFRLALVPAKAPVESVYRTMQRDFQILGIETRIFGELDEAKTWLEA